MHRRFRKVIQGKKRRRGQERMERKKKTRKSTGDDIVNYRRNKRMDEKITQRKRKSSLKVRKR